MGTLNAFLESNLNRILMQTLTQKRSELSAKEEELQKVKGRFGQSESVSDRNGFSRDDLHSRISA